MSEKKRKIIHIEECRYDVQLLPTLLFIITRMCMRINALRRRPSVHIANSVKSAFPHWIFSRSLPLMVYSTALDAYT